MLYTVILYGPRSAELATTLLPLKEHCAFVALHSSQELIGFCTLQKPDLLVGFLSDEDESLLQIAAQLRSLQWVVPIVALFPPELSTRTRYAAETLHFITVAETKTYRSARLIDALSRALGIHAGEA